VTELPHTIGPYRIVEPLGRGGMGVVYRAEHLQSAKPVALKTVLVPHEGMLQGIRREIHALARISHPGIVRIVEEGVEEGRPWYAMELLEGETLRQYIGSSGHTTLQRVLTIVRRLCAPLSFLHGEGVVHRDLKPENVLVRRDGMPVLVDFGLASQFTAKLSREVLELRAGSAAGTVAYMAPEQARGELVDARADLYALGCMLYELLAGRPPFVGTMAIQVLYQHFNTAPRPPSELAPGVPPELDALILSLLAKRPQDRLGHADDVAAALDRLGAEDGLASASPKPRAYLYRPGFTGREEPFLMLTERLSGVEQNGTGSLVLIGGESGVGKTRLAMELIRAATPRRNRVLSGECLPPAAGVQGQGGAPLQPLRSALQQIADRCREKGLEETERLLGKRGKLLALYEPSLAGLPGQDAYPEPAELPAEAALLRLYTYLADTFAALAGGAAGWSPVLLILDDLHWADDVTLGLLGFLLRTGRLEAMALLIVGTYRTEEVEALGRAPLKTVLEAPSAWRLALGRLDQKAVGSIVADMLALAEPPETFVRYLTRQSEGNPFFVAEVLRTAVAEAVLYRDAVGRWRVAAEAEAVTEAVYEALPLPHSLRELVGLRLDGLSAPTRRLAEAAAVLGREVHEAMLAEVSGMEDSEILDATREILARQVLEELEGGRLRFVHDKIREVTYECIAASQRQALHLTAARAMERRPEAERGEMLAAMGHHWEQAGERSKARDCYLAGARAAKARYTQDEAERLYRAYLRLVDTPTPESVVARYELAWDILFMRNKAPESIPEHHKALAEARELGDRETEGNVLRGFGAIFRNAGQIKDACVVYEQALQLARQTRDPRAEGLTQVALGVVLREQGRMDEARGLCERALAIAHEARDTRTEEYALAELADFHREQGRMDEAYRLYEKYLHLAREHGNRRLEAGALRHLGLLRYEQGRLEEGFALCSESLAVFRAIGELRFESHALLTLAMFPHVQGRFDEARVLYEQALARQRDVGERRHEGITLNNLGDLYFEQGRLEEARVAFEQALVVLRELGNRRFEGVSLGNLALVHHQQGRPEEARTRSEQALAILREVGDRREEGIHLDHRATMERRTGDLADVERFLGEAERLLEEVDARLELGSCLCTRGHLALAQGRSARDLLDRALRLGATLRVGVKGSLGKKLSRLSRSVEAFEAGRPLFRGEHVEGLPEGLRRWLITSGRLEAPR
jgi:tetratricopeptide (TPR) repeat protein